MTVFAALLRAVNVGGTGLIRMAELKAICEELGFRHVQTLLQSGNVVFAAKGAATAVAEKLADSIEESHKFRPAIAIRTVPEVAGIVDRNPFPREVKSDPRFVVVAFATGAPTSGAKGRVAAVGVVRERLHLSGRELYIHYPDGQGRSIVSNAVLEKALGVPATARNWNTVTKLLHLAREMEG